MEMAYNIMIKWGIILYALVNVDYAVSVIELKRKMENQKHLLPFLKN
jgi:hypothetical protein